MYILRTCGCRRISRKIINSLCENECKVVVSGMDCNGAGSPEFETRPVKVLEDPRLVPLRIWRVTPVYINIYFKK